MIEPPARKTVKTYTLGYLIHRQSAIAARVFDELNMKLLLHINWVEPANLPGQTHAIANIGGISGEFQWKHSEAQAIAHIESGLFEYFIREDSRSLRVHVAIAPDGSKYLAAGGRESIPLAHLQSQTHA